MLQDFITYYRAAIHAPFAFILSNPPVSFLRLDLPPWYPDMVVLSALGGALVVRHENERRLREGDEYDFLPDVGFNEALKQPKTRAMLETVQISVLAFSLVGMLGWLSVHIALGRGLGALVLAGREQGHIDSDGREYLRLSRDFAIMIALVAFFFAYNAYRP